MAGKKGAVRKPPITIAACREYATVLRDRSAFLDGVAANLASMPQDTVLHFDGAGRMELLLKSINAWACDLQKAAADYAVDAIQYPKPVPENGTDYAVEGTPADNKPQKKSKKREASGA